MQRGKVINSSSMESATCHTGTPKGMRINMATGEVNGIIESHTDKLPEGCPTIAGISSSVSISGTVIGRVNCCESVSLSTNEPAAAKNEAYSRYPNTK